ncbi:MAG TPA: SGNH/GDSL hydrolase N-terminal domain-containing protein, partial [Planctomycetota bacterium]|nr:SGNH/GDSL hydrolase N-terminal domain-containing protein [Planctomycetota bacterium]
MGQLQPPAENAAARIDPNMAVRDAEGDICWYDLAGLTIEGMGWSGTEGPYERLPARASGKVPEAVWKLSKDSAGICARFVTDATAVYARWTLKDPNLAMDHMPATGVSGLDLYVRSAGVWRWAGVGRPKESPTNRQELTRGRLAAERRECLIYLPLYNGVSAVQLGLPSAARLEKAPPRPAGRSRPVVFYGTSIVQGGCASRPGMAYPAILGRWLDVPTVNLGFSGSARMEPEVAELVAEPDAAAFVLDCLPNAQPPEVADGLNTLIDYRYQQH